MPLWRCMLLALLGAALIATASAQVETTGAGGSAARSAGGGGGFAFVNKGYGEDTSGGSVGSIAASAINVTSGNLLVVFCRAGSGSPSITVTDTASNTFTSAASVSSGPVGIYQAFYAKNVTGNASDVVTCGYNVNTTFVSTTVLQYSGASTSAPLDATATGNTSLNTTGTTGTFSTVNSNEIIAVGFTVDAVSNTFSGGSIGAGTGTLRTTNTSMSGAEDLIVSSTQSGITASAVVSLTHTWLLIAATFK